MRKSVTQWIYNRIIVTPLCSPISIKFFLLPMQSGSAGIRHGRACMHDAFDVPDWPGRVYSVYPEVNKLGDATTTVAVYDGADGFTSLIKFCGRVCHFSRHRRLVGDEPRRTSLFCGKYKLRRRSRERRKGGRKRGKFAPPFLKLRRGNDPLFFSYTTLLHTNVRHSSATRTNNRNICERAGANDRRSRRISFRRVIDPFTSYRFSARVNNLVIEHDRGRHVARVSLAIGVCVTLS